MVVVEDRFEIEDQRPVPLDPKGGRGEERAVHALDPVLAKDAPRRTARRAGRVVIEAVQELLDAPGGSQPREETRLPPGQAEIRERVLAPAHPGIMRSGPPAPGIESGPPGEEKEEWTFDGKP